MRRPSTAAIVYWTLVVATPVVAMVLAMQGVSYMTGLAATVGMALLAVGCLVILKRRSAKG